MFPISLKWDFRFKTIQLEWTLLWRLEVIFLTCWKNKKKTFKRYLMDAMLSMYYAWQCKSVFMSKSNHNWKVLWFTRNLLHLAITSNFFVIFQVEIAWIPCLWRISSRPPSPALYWKTSIKATFITSWKRTKKKHGPIYSE